MGLKVYEGMLYTVPGKIRKNSKKVISFENYSETGKSIDDCTIGGKQILLSSDNIPMERHIKSYRIPWKKEIQRFMYPLGILQLCAILYCWGEGYGHTTEKMYRRYYRRFKRKKQYR